MKKQLPHTDSISELADFWDKHDLTDFEGELEVVRECVFEQGTSVNVHLEAGEFERIERDARSKGRLGFGTRSRMNPRETSSVALL
jgi:hypothetical protein